MPRGEEGARSTREGYWQLRDGRGDGGRRGEASEGGLPWPRESSCEKVGKGKKEEREREERRLEGKEGVSCHSSVPQPALAAFVPTPAKPKPQGQLSNLSSAPFSPSSLLPRGPVSPPRHRQQTLAPNAGPSRAGAPAPGMAKKETDRLNDME